MGTNIESIISLFSGIGGIERGLEAAGLTTILQCDSCDAARAVLKKRFKASKIEKDVRLLKGLPNGDLVTAGFPCQDLSQAGQAKGIKGKNSSLVSHVFDLIARKRSKPNWILLENVPFMLQLDQGLAMATLVQFAVKLGYRWAYRVIDTRSFGIPQRRRRVIFLASRSGQPRDVLLADTKDPRTFEIAIGSAHGFYWTEGNTGLGWTTDGVPTLKGGSTIGIPSPPGIWMTDAGSIVTPDIRDAERLQGFPPNWTKPACEVSRESARWKLIGNAFPVPISKWIGKRLISNKKYLHFADDKRLEKRDNWPNAAWGEEGVAYASSSSEWPSRIRYNPLENFLNFPTSPLSFKATAGFYSRAKASSLNFPIGFLRDVRRHMLSMESRRLAESR